MMYDIFLEMGCYVQPDLSSVIEQIPALVDSLLLAHIMQRETQPGLLGLDLSASLASALLECLIAADARGYRIPSIYQHPQLTLDEATVYATQGLAKRLNEKHAEPSFFPVDRIIDEGVCWIFGFSPVHRGYWCIRVDKLDGHLWSPDEIHHLKDESRVMQRKIKYAGTYAVGMPLMRWPERYETYDIVISSACRTQPHIQDLTQAIPGLANELLQARFVVNGMMTKEEYVQWADFPFLELDLSYNLAKKLAFRLQEAGAWANYIPTVYRKPQFSFTRAQVLAEQVIKERHERVTPHEPLGSVGLYPWLWTPYWIFGASSPAAPPEPGCLFAYIDKVDGHIWPWEEVRLFNREGH